MHDWRLLWAPSRYLPVSSAKQDLATLPCCRVIGLNRRSPPSPLASFVVVQSLSCVQLFVTLWTAACQASLFFTISWFCSNSCPLSRWYHPTIFLLCLLLLPPSVFPNIRVFSSESALCIRWPKYWSFSFNICPSNEYSGLISFRIDWSDLLAVQVLKTI